MGTTLYRPALYAITLITAMVLSPSIGCGDRSQTSQPEDEAQRVNISRISTELTALNSRGKRLKLEVSLEELVKASIESSNSLALVESSGTGAPPSKTARLRVNARLIPDGFTKKLHAFIETRVTNTGAIPLTSHIDATLEEVPEGAVLDDATYVKHLKRAVADSIKAIDEQAAVLYSANTTLINALETKERDVRMAAIRTLGERKATDAVEPLCGVLRREKNEVGQATIGALVMIDDEKAVPCIIQWAGSDDRRLVLILDPLASIGGQESQAFLEMIASGHDSHAVKTAAETSLRRIESTLKTKSKTIQD